MRFANRNYPLPALATPCGLELAHLDTYGISMEGPIPDLTIGPIEDQLRDAYRAELVEMGYEDPADQTPIRWTWDEHGNVLESDQVLACLSRLDACRLQYLNRWANDFDKRMEDDPDWTPVWKVNNVLRKAMRGDGWQAAVRILRGIRAFSFGLEGFWTRLDWARYFNEAGHGQYNGKVWYDGPLALVVGKGAEPVLSISFGFRDSHILVHQIQLRKAKGNRWLYRLDRPLVDHVLTRLEAAFGPQGLALALVDGESAVQAVRDAYRDKAEFDAKGVADRIRATYDGPLQAYRRTDPIRFCRTFWRVESV